MDWPSESEIRSNVAERASHCPGCERESEPSDVHNAQDYTGDDHYGINCPGCGKWDYDDDMRRWTKRTAPGEENPTVSRS